VLYFPFPETTPITAKILNVAELKKTIQARVTRNEKLILKTYVKDGQIYATAI